ncbi:hypothetical protein N3K66_007963 [Trichothecium roseum]|uniref:Uncharacterized protein n=1 Tax=Trichothecium roseum TaxID=47278 RepID=A0ACC0UTG0_9HYPO|nr:hypothetical protein N3K66_007963 [Trichothecium roseum]
MSSSKVPIRKGSCLCGRVRTVEIDDPETAVRGYDDKSCDNGGTVRRSFCSRCGANVCIVNLTNPAIRDFVIVPMGIVDEEEEDQEGQDEGASSKPGSEFYVKRRVGWFPGVEGAKEFQGMS